MNQSDHLVRCITTDGSIIAMAVDSTVTVQTAQSLHHASAVASAALGRLMTGALLMGSAIKSARATVTLRVNGGGPIGSLIASADHDGHVRGYAQHPDVELPLNEKGKLDVGGAVGRDGVLNVVCDSGTGEPYTGQVRLVSGEIAEDVTEYYARSAQTPTICALGVLADKTDHAVILAGGLLVQLLPSAPEAAIAQLERNLPLIEPVTTMLAKGMSPADICRRALDGFDVRILADAPVHYACTCSRERVVRAIAGLPSGEIEALQDAQGYAEARCPYCARTYRLTNEELEKMANQKKQEEKLKKLQKNP